MEGRAPSPVPRQRGGRAGAPGSPPASLVFRGDMMIGAKLKIALLYDVWNEDPVAAEKEEAVPARKPRKKVKKVKKEKTDREEIFEALQKLGHEPSYFEL